MKLGRRTRLVAILIGVSLPGILLIALQAPGMVEHLDVELPPRATLMLGAAVQGLVLVAAMAALGTWLAPKVSLAAPVVEGWVEGEGGWPTLASQAAVGLPLGIGIGVMIVVAEVAVFRPYLPDSLYLLASPMTLGYFLAALTYGGIVEEVLLRWGAMSLFAWLIHRASGRRSLGMALMVGNVLAAILFGVGHLPAVAVTVGELTTPIVVRTVTLNAVPGFVFGALFQRRGLEAAMFAHMGTHLGMAVPRILFGA